MRRIPPRQFTPDKQTGVMRPSSAAFDDDEDGEPMSVYRSDVIVESGGSVQRVLVGHKGYAVSAIAAGFVRAFQQSVHSDPLPEEESHAVVCGHKTESIRRKMAKQARWAVRPEAE